MQISILPHPRLPLGWNWPPHYTGPGYTPALISIHSDRAWLTFQRWMDENIRIQMIELYPISLLAVIAAKGGSHSSDWWEVNTSARHYKLKNNTNHCKMVIHELLFIKLMNCSFYLKFPAVQWYLRMSKLWQWACGKENYFLSQKKKICLSDWVSIHFWFCNVNH